MYEAMLKMIFPFDSTFYNIISTLVLVYLLWSLKDLVQTRHMPPSPWFSLPLMGHFMYLSKRMHEDVTNLARRYGPVISLRLGTLRVVFVNGPDAVKEVLIKKSVDFSGRPTTYPLFRTLGMNGKGVIFSVGLVWKVHRKLLMSSIRDKLSDQAGIEDRIMREVKILLESFSKTEARPLNPEELITLCVSNVICGVGFGKHFDGDEGDYKCFINNTKAMDRNFAITGIANFLPVPSFFANVLLSRLRALLHNQVSVIGRYVLEHQAKVQPTKKPQDLIECMLQAKVKAMEDSKDNITQILSNEFLDVTARDIFLGGFETTTTTLRWVLLYLVNHPEHQEAMQSELDKVVPPDQLPSLNNRNDLPLLQAAVLETLRLSNLAPLLAPHSSIQDTNIMGYHIPKDTVVFVNAWSVHMDPKCWENPKEFNPYRFIDGDGNLVTNMGNFYPFSAGRRVCPGESLAKVELFLILGSILHTYKLEHKKGINFLDEEGDLGLSLFPKPYELVFVKRRC